MSNSYLVFKNITRKKVRLFLLLVSITIAFFIFTLLNAFQGAMNAGVDISADDRLITINKINFTQTLPYSYYNKIKATAGVKAAVHMNWFGGYYVDPKNFLVVIAMSNQEFLNIYADTYALPQQQWQNYQNNRSGLLVGSDTAKKNNWSVGDTIPLKSNIFSNKDGSDAWNFTIEGIFSSIDPVLPAQELYFHYQYFNESVTFGKDRLGWVVIQTEDPNLNDRVINTIDNQFKNSPDETETMPEKAFNKQFVEQIGNIGLIIQSVVGAAFFTILMLVGNSMVTSIKERTAEIAVLKTLGFQSRSIFYMVLAESLTLTVIGGVIGVLLAYGVVPALNHISGGMLPAMSITDSVLLQTAAIMLILGFLTGIIPAWSALKLKVIAALNKN